MSKLDLWLRLILPLCILLSSGLLILHSVSPGDFTSQVIFTLLGIMAMLLISRIDYQLTSFSPWPWYATTVILLALTLILGVTSRGSTRWIEIVGFRFQPSEFIKPMYILFMSVYLSLKPPESLKDSLQYLAYGAVPAALVFFQPDLGTALILFGILAASLIASGLSFKHLAVYTLVILAIVPLGMPLLQPYQRQRLNTFLNPQADPLGTGYNAMQATIAVGSGKFLGKGLGQGTQSQLRFLPERHTDFVFASYIEELGFLGGIILIGSYIWLFFGLASVARKASSDVGSLICILTIALILIQVTINIGMNMSVMPVTGITLPFISAGGSSLLSLLILLGLCLSVARRANNRPKTLQIR